MNRLVLLLILIFVSCKTNKPDKDCDDGTPCKNQCESLTVGCIDTNSKYKERIKCNSAVLSFPNSVFKGLTPSEIQRFHDSIIHSLMMDFGGAGIKASISTCLCNYPIYEINVGSQMDIEGVIATAQNNTEVEDNNGSLSLNYLFKSEGVTPQSITNYVIAQGRPCSEQNCFESKYNGSLNSPVLAILDSGISPEALPSRSLFYSSTTHDCLNGGDDFSGWNFVDDNELILDNNGHGFLVAKSYFHGIDNINGFEPRDQRLLPVKVLDECGSGNLFDIVCGMYYAYDKGASVINMSLGAMISADVNILDEAVSFLDDNDIKLITSSGNEDIALPELNRKHYPSCFSVDIDISNNNVFEVGSSCRSIISLSGYGSKKARHSNYRDEMFVESGLKIEALLDPVLQELIKNNGCSIFGTSFATPLVSSRIISNPTNSNAYRATCVPVLDVGKRFYTYNW